MWCSWMTNLIFLAPINNTSYGLTGLNICHQLDKKNVLYYLFPLPSANRISFENNKAPENIVNAIKRSQFFDPDVPAVRLWHQFDMAQFVGRGPHIGFPIFELDKFNELELHHLRSVDRLFVTTKWAKSIIEQNNIRVDTRVVPLGVNRDVFFERQKIPKDHKYRFLNIGKLEIRKGHDILCELFNKAFTKEDDVELLVSFINLGLQDTEYEKWVKMYKSSPLGDKIQFVPRVKTQNEVAELISYGDCLLQPSRAEGWNLPLLEAMSCNRPTITTNYSAHTEFCNNFNSFLVDITETELAYDGRYFFGQGNWAKISTKEKDQFVDYMRYCYEERLRENQEGINTAEKFSWKNCAEKLISNIS